MVVVKDLREKKKIEKKTLMLYLMSAQVTQGRRNSGKKTRVKYTLPYFPAGVCRPVFQLAFGVSRWIVNGCLQLVKAQSLKIPEHKGVGNSNKMNSEEHKTIKEFLYRVRDKHGEAHAKRTYQRLQKDGKVHTEVDKRDFTLLPCAFSIYKLLAIYNTLCREKGLKESSRRTFRRVWLKDALLKNMIIRSPSKDECDFCVALAHMKSHAFLKGMTTNNPAYEKAESEYRAHCDAYHGMRDLYEANIVRARNDQDGFFVCISFDYAQCASVPYAAQQPGPFYFYCPFKLYHFGICDEGTDIQHHFVYGEDQFGKGANQVVSLIHLYLTSIRWRKEQDENVVMPKEMVFWADNCAGQNKNKTVLQYLAWLVQQPDTPEVILLNFQIKGHTRNSVDRHFGDVKKLYYRSQVWVPKDYVNVVDECTTTDRNIAVDLYGKNDLFLDWGEKLHESFTALVGIANYQIFKFERANPGMCFVKKAPADNWESKKLFKTPTPSMFDPSLPPTSKPLGLKPEKRVLFHKSYYSHIPIDRPELKDQFYYPRPDERICKAADAASKCRGGQRKTLNEFATLEGAEAAQQRHLKMLETRAASFMPALAREITAENASDTADSSTPVAPVQSVTPPESTALSPIAAPSLTREQALQTISPQPAKAQGKKRGPYKKSNKQLAKEALKRQKTTADIPAQVENQAPTTSAQGSL